MLDVKCSTCHTGENSGGWNTGDHATTQAAADASQCSGKTVYECMIIRILDGSMPNGKGCSAPALPGDDVQCLSAADIAIIQSWVDGGGKE